jgi:hypothetical protein
MIDYERMQRVSRGQKAALTRAINSKDPWRVAKACRAAVTEWNEIGAWPDNWHRWNIAFRDAYGRGSGLEDLAFLHRAEVSNARDAEEVDAYLPDNYRVAEVRDDGTVVVEGFDTAGWTFEDYVAPRLASGLMFCTEVTL